ncbi:MAG: sodium:solute symporter [Bacteroidales bacterium]|nr:sodium:solute symporter [Bacteroidales bacterium]
MNPYVIASIVIGYFALLILISFLTSRKANNDTFFTGNRRSPWFVVAYGMIGASLSGVTFMSVPGYVQSSQFTYFGVVLGYTIGYVVIAFVLLPLYYKLNLTSIYTYLDRRFGSNSQRTGSFFFIVSRLMGSALRMYLVVFVLHEFVFKAIGVPFWALALFFIVLILVYTFKGGIKTIIWTDTLQTTFLLLSTVITIVFLLKEMDISFFDMMSQAADDGYTKMFETDWRSNNFFLKQILSGAFITIAMTGLDQDMMQKNLTCKSLKEAKKNMLSFSVCIVIVNILFLVLGVALMTYSSHTGFVLPEKSDSIFAAVAQNLGSVTWIIFIIGLVAAGYSSADGTLTSLTTTFCFDILQFDKKPNYDEQKKTRTRKITHIAFAAIYFLIIIVFKPFHTDSLIKTLFDIAGYTYGPLLGLFCFGLFVKRRNPNDKAVPFIAILSPVISYLLNIYSEELFFGYKFGFEILIVNGLLTFIGLLIFSKKSGNMLLKH